MTRRPTHHSREPARRPVNSDVPERLLLKAAYFRFGHEADVARELKQPFAPAFQLAPANRTRINVRSRKLDEVLDK